MIRINEVFGPTIQGEGPHTGRHCLFVRVSRCNLHCSWCDTPYTWAHTPHKAELHNSGHLYDPSVEEHELSVEDILEKLEDLWPIREHPTLIVISGGEPMLQQKELHLLVQNLIYLGETVEVETAGTIIPNDDTIFSNSHAIHYNVSPKLSHSGNTERARRNIDALHRLARMNSDFKFVVTSEEDFDEVEMLVELAEIENSSVWIMPEGTNVQDIRAHGLAVVDKTLEMGWNMSLRNHVWLWGEERGK